MHDAFSIAFYKANPSLTLLLLLAAKLLYISPAVDYRKVMCRIPSWLVTPHVTNQIQIWLVTRPIMSDICLNELKLCEVSWNPFHTEAESFSFLSWQNKKVMLGMLVLETLKCKTSDFLNSNTCFCLRLYGVSISKKGRRNFQPHEVSPFMLMYDNMLISSYWAWLKSPMHCIIFARVNKQTIIMITITILW